MKSFFVLCLLVPQLVIASNIITQSPIDNELCQFASFSKHKEIPQYSTSREYYQSFIYKGGKGIQLSAGKQDKKATVELAVLFDKSRLNVGFSANLDDDKASFANQDGLNSNAAFTLKWSYDPEIESIQVLTDKAHKHIQQYSNQYDIVQKECQNKYRQYLGKDISQETQKEIIKSINELNELSTLNTSIDNFIKKIQEERSQPQYYTSYSIIASVGRTPFKYLDINSIITTEDLAFKNSDESAYELGGSISFYNTVNTSVIEFGASYESFYNFLTGQKKSFCRQYPDNILLDECFSAIIETPQKQKQKNIYASFSKNIEAPYLKAFAIKTNYDLEQNRWNISLPLYFFIDGKDKPVAGIRFDYLDKAKPNEETFQTTIFYSTPFEI